MESDENELQEPLATWARWVMAVAGVVLLVAGAVAVFLSNTNVAGVPLLIVAGAGFLYSALAGQPMLQLNKDGFTFARIQRLRRSALAVASDPAVPAEVRERIVEAFEENGVSVVPPMTERDLERAAFDTFASLGRDYGFTVTDGSEARDTGADIELVGASGQTVAIEVRTRLTTRALAAAIRELRKLGDGHRILVVDRTLPREFVQAFSPEGISILAFGPTFRNEALELLQQLQFVDG